LTHGAAKSVIQFEKESHADPPRFKFVMLGRTRGVQEDGHKFAVPRVKVTQAHLRPGVCLERLLKAKEELGQMSRKLLSKICGRLSFANSRTIFIAG
jgi:hypothetical protein